MNRFQTPNNRFTGVRTATRKYVKYDSGFEELFDLQADPHELTNAAGEAGLRGRPRHRSEASTSALKSCTGPSCFVP